MQQGPPLARYPLEAALALSREDSTPRPTSNKNLATLSMQILDEDTRVVIDNNAQVEALERGAAREGAVNPVC